MPAATDTAAPPLDPPAVRVRSRGLRVTPYTLVVGHAAVAELRVVGLADDDRAGGDEALDADAVLVGHEVGQRA